MKGTHQIGAECTQEDAALKRHGGRHGEDQLVALGSSHEGKGNARVAAGGLDQCGLREKGGGERCVSVWGGGGSHTAQAQKADQALGEALDLAGADLALDLSICDHAVSDPAPTAAIGSAADGLLPRGQEAIGGRCLLPCLSFTLQQGSIDSSLPTTLPAQPSVTRFR